MTTSTIPSPPPEDDGSELHTLTLEAAQHAIEVLHDRERESIATVWSLEARIVELQMQSDELGKQLDASHDRIVELQNRITELTSERR